MNAIGASCELERINEAIAAMARHVLMKPVINF